MNNERLAFLPGAKVELLRTVGAAIKVEAGSRGVVTLLGRKVHASFKRPDGSTVRVEAPRDKVTEYYKQLIEGLHNE